jgi:hypothetical protein
VSRRINKDSLLYANVNPTHPSRAHAMEVARQLTYTTIETGVSFDQYIRSLARHKFCLCPRGNGIDTHRFWEALYLDAIPVIIKSDWTSAYSGFPLLLLDSWDQLLTIDLNKQYVKIKSTAYCFDRLSLKYFSKIILNSVPG